MPVVEPMQGTRMQMQALDQGKRFVYIDRFQHVPYVRPFFPTQENKGSVILGYLKMAIVPLRNVCYTR